MNKRELIQLTKKAALRLDPKCDIRTPRARHGGALILGDNDSMTLELSAETNAKKPDYKSIFGTGSVITDSIRCLYTDKLVGFYFGYKLKDCSLFSLFVYFAPETSSAGKAAAHGN